MVPHPTDAADGSSGDAAASSAAASSRPSTANATPADNSSGGLRASDADREQVNDVLTAAYAEGRLTRSEYDERADQVLAAKTFDELIPITRDLVYAGSVPPDTAPRPAGAYVDTAHADEEVERMIAVFGGADRKGRWRIRRHSQAFALFGGVDLDLREAIFDAPTVEISGLICFGGLDIKVPEGVEVRDHTVAIFGGTDTKKLEPPEPGAPVVVLKGFALFGGVDVKTVRAKKTGWRKKRKADRSSPDPAEGDGLGDQLGDLGQQLGDHMDRLGERWEERRQDRMDRRQDRSDRRQDRWGERRRVQRDDF